MTHIGNKIKNVRIEKNKKLKDLSSETGLSVSYLSDIMNDRADPSLKSLLKISKALGVTNSYLLEEQEIYTVKNFTRLEGLIKDFSSWPTEYQEKTIGFLEDIIKLVNLDKNDNLK